MHQLFIEVLRAAAWLGIFALVFVPLERLFAVHPQALWRRGIGLDIAYYFLSVLLPGVLLAVPLGGVAWCAQHMIPPGLRAATAALPFWATLPISLVSSEVAYYWYHRLSHRIPWLWRFHAIHHSATEIDFLVNTRAHPLDLMLGRLCGLTPLYLLGLGAPAGGAGGGIPAAVALAGALWSYFIHANLRWRFGALENLLATPAFHHWHHALGGAETSNYAATLPWLDRIFGTYQLPRRDWPQHYGIAAALPDSLAGQLAYPLRGLRAAAPPSATPPGRPPTPGRDATEAPGPPSSALPSWPKDRSTQRAATPSS